MAARALVTGVAGFIGSHLAEACLKQGMEVTGADSLEGGTTANLPAGVEFFQGDLREKAFVEGLFKNGRFDFIYHFAAYAAEGLSHHIRSFNYSTNLGASVQLINQAILTGCRRFVFASSAAVYGEMPGPWREDVSPDPMDPYGIAKLAVEMDLKAAAQKFGLQYTVFRPHNVYGERQNIMDPYRNVVGIFIRCCLESKKLPIFGDGSQTRAFTYVKDISGLMADSVNRESACNQVFNIGSGEKLSIVDLGREVSGAFGIAFQPEWLEERLEAMHCPIDHSRFLRCFPEFRPTPLRTGLSAMISWARISQSHKTLLPLPEVAIGMPESWRKGQSH